MSERFDYDKFIFKLMQHVNPNSDAFTDVEKWHINMYLKSPKVSFVELIREDLIEDIKLLLAEPREGIIAKANKKKDELYGKK